MIFVECQVIDHRTNGLGGKYNKNFTDHTDFVKWYDLTKKDGYVIINVMKYNPQDNPGLAETNYLKLIRASMEQ